MSYPRVPIGDLVSLRQGFAINKNTKHHISDESTALPLLRIADMKDKVQNVFVKDTIPAHFIAKPEDIIYTRTGQVGLVFTDQYGVIHNNCFTVTPNDAKTLNRYYLYYVLQSEDFYSAANNLASGAAQSDLPHGAFRSIEIPVPPLASQMRIAEILKGYDDLIENNQKQIKLLEEAAQRLYKEWFIDLRFPGHETAPIVDGVPEGWAWGTLADIALFRRGKTITKDQVKAGIIPVVAGGLEPAYYHDTPNTNVPVVTVSGSGANAGFTRMYHTKVWASDCSYIDAAVTKDTAWVYCFLKGNKASIDAMQKGAAQPHVYAKDINAMKALFPDDKLMEQFRVIADLMFTRIGKLDMQIERLAEARDRLLPKLMSGEIEV